MNFNVLGSCVSFVPCRCLRTLLANPLRISCCTQFSILILSPTQVCALRDVPLPYVPCPGGNEMTHGAQCSLPIEKVVVWKTECSCIRVRSVRKSQRQHGTDRSTNPKRRIFVPVNLLRFIINKRRQCNPWLLFRLLFVGAECWEEGSEVVTMLMLIPSKHLVSIFEKRESIRILFVAQSTPELRGR